MTEGTSQGLFIVVAIVIFGVFVSLSYTLFGSQGLSNDLTGLFNKSTEKTTDSLLRLEKVEEFSLKSIEPWNTKNFESDLVKNKFKFSSDKTYKGGLKFPADYFIEGETYRLSFEMTKLSGNIKGIGGHLFVAEKTKVTLDGKDTSDIWRTNTNIGKDKENAWSFGVKYPNDKEKHTVSVTFKVIPNSFEITKDLNVYIQPNRNNSLGYVEAGLEFEALIENIKLDKINIK